MAHRNGGSESAVARVAAALLELVSESGDDIEDVIASPERLHVLATDVLAGSGEDVGEVLIDLAERLVIDLRDGADPIVEIDLRSR